MNKITFDNIVLSDPKQFSYVTLPDKKKIKVPNKGKYFSSLIKLLFVQFIYFQIIYRRSNRMCGERNINSLAGACHLGDISALRRFYNQLQGL